MIISYLFQERRGTENSLRVAFEHLKESFDLVAVLHRNGSDTEVGVVERQMRTHGKRNDDGFPRCGLGDPLLL